MLQATDGGDRPLIGFCQFKVHVEDVNDNAPTFDRPLYETSMARGTRTGAAVLTVLAEDRDALVASFLSQRNPLFRAGHGMPESLTHLLRMRRHRQSTAKTIASLTSPTLDLARLLWHGKCPPIESASNFR